MLESNPGSYRPPISAVCYANSKGEKLEQCDQKGRGGGVEGGRRTTEQLTCCCTHSLQILFRDAFEVLYTIPSTDVEGLPGVARSSLIQQESRKLTQI